MELPVLVYIINYTPVVHVHVHCVLLDLLAFRFEEFNKHITSSSYYTVFYDGTSSATVDCSTSSATVALLVVLCGMVWYGTCMVVLALPVPVPRTWYGMDTVPGTGTPANNSHTYLTNEFSNRDSIILKSLTKSCFPSRDLHYHG